MAKSDNNNKHGKSKRSYWWIKVFFLTLALSAAFGFISETVLTRTHFIVAAVVLLVFMVVNVVCDVLGTAVATCEVEPFQSMAARKIKGAKTALRILKHAEKFNNITNDVVGDICAVVGGAMGVALVRQIIKPYEWDEGNIYRILVFVAASAL
ncbi:MAG: hypothetical protein LBL66_06855, partial [Clostridiales bacterium]|nr:hypothetical protein [Clostridiales bacterium]